MHGKECCTVKVSRSAMDTMWPSNPTKQRLEERSPILQLDRKNIFSLQPIHGLLYLCPAHQGSEHSVFGKPFLRSLFSKFLKGTY